MPSLFRLGFQDVVQAMWTGSVSSFASQIKNGGKNIPFGTTAVINSLGQTATLGFTFSDIGLGGMDGVDTGQL